MYCPKCGRADQQPEHFCIGCGQFLPDLESIESKLTSPKVHLNANITLSGMTIVVCLTLIVLNWIFTDSGSHSMMSYVTWGFLFAITAWHIQSLWRSIILRRHFVEHERAREMPKAPTERQLRAVAAADQTEPARVTKRTTNRLGR